MCTPNVVVGGTNNKNRRYTISSENRTARTLKPARGIQAALTPKMIKRRHILPPMKYIVCTIVEVVCSKEPRFPNRLGNAAHRS
jgi:hypothetical protein